MTRCVACPAASSSCSTTMGERSGARARGGRECSRPIPGLTFPSPLHSASRTATYRTTYDL
jgi:hypothetical protein